MESDYDLFMSMLLRAGFRCSGREDVSQKLKFVELEAMEGNGPIGAKELYRTNDNP